MSPVTALVPLLALTLAVPAAAAESGIEDAVETLYREAAEAADLWACLQLEAYGARHGIRLGDCLGRGSSAHGDPVLSWPWTVVASFDRGDETLVIAGRRRYRVAPDGRPLDRGHWLPFVAEAADLSPDGRFLAIAALDGPETQRTLHLAVIRLANGATVLRQDQALGAAVPPAEDALRQVRVAADGSAAAALIQRKGVIPDTRHAVVAGPAGVTLTAGIYWLEAVGSDGAWLVGRQLDGADGCYLAGVLAQAGRVGSARSASGAGLAVMRSEDGLLLVAADGTAAPWIPTGPEAAIDAVHGIGDWLVVRSADATADEAADEAAIDLFAPPPGAPPEPAADLFAAATASSEAAAPAALPPPPATTWLYRWRQLAKDPAAAPLRRYPGSAAPAPSHGEALLLWDGPALGLLDLGAEQPVRRELATLPTAITAAWFDGFHYVVALHGGAHVVLDHHGTELAVLPAEAGARVAIRSPGAAIVHRYTEAGEVDQPQLVALAADPTARRVVPLPEWPAGHSTNYAVAADDASDLVVGSGADWRRYDTATGTVVARGGEGYPRIPRSLEAHGRFHPTWGGSHLVPLGEREPPPLPRWHVRDASLVGRSLLVLDATGSVHAPARRGWQLLGALPELQRFVSVPGDKGIFLGATDHLATAELVPRRGLAALSQPRPATAPDHGSWQVVGLQYTVPGRPSPLRWHWQGTGFAPERLQGVGREALLAFTPGVVLELAPGAAAGCGIDLRELAEARREAAAEAEQQKAKARARLEQQRR